MLFSLSLSLSLSLSFPLSPSLPSTYRAFCTLYGEGDTNYDTCSCGPHSLSLTVLGPFYLPLLSDIIHVLPPLSPLSLPLPAAASSLHTHTHARTHTHTQARTHTHTHTHTHT